MLDFAINSAIAESWRDCQTLTEQSRFRERAARISTTHLYLCLSDCSSTRIFKCTHMYRNIWTTANQRGGPPFTISDWFRPRYEPNVSVVEQQRDFLSRRDFSFFLEWLDAPVRPQIFFCRTLEKLGHTCDQIGHSSITWVSPAILKTFYSGAIESVLTQCISVWYGNSLNQDCKALRRVVRLAERISGSALPSLQDIYLKRCKSRAAKIIKDPNHHLFCLLPSGKRFRSMMAKTERLRRSFFPQAIRLLNTNSVS